jgi:hypothetical protein
LKRIYLFQFENEDLIYQKVVSVANEMDGGGLGFSYLSMASYFAGKTDQHYLRSVWSLSGRPNEIT